MWMRDNTVFSSKLLENNLIISPLKPDRLEKLIS